MFKQILKYQLTRKFIRKEDGKWNVYSRDGKLLGSHATEKEALEHLRAIEANKGD